MSEASLDLAPSSPFSVPVSFPPARPVVWGHPKPRKGGSAPFGTPGRGLARAPWAPTRRKVGGVERPLDGQLPDFEKPLSPVRTWPGRGEKPVLKETLGRTAVRPYDRGSDPAPDSSIRSEPVSVSRLCCWWRRMTPSEIIYLSILGWGLIGVRMGAFRLPRFFSSLRMTTEALILPRKDRQSRLLVILLA